MNDLRKAAEMALEALMQRGEHHPKVYQAAEALRQALDDKPAVKTYAGGKPNYCTPNVDAVNMTQDRVDEMAKGEHEPVAWVQPNGEIVVRTDYGGRLYYSEQNVYTAQKVAQWMIEQGYATGHGDTIEELLKELEWQAAERERDACVTVCCDMIDTEYKTGKVDHNEMAWTQACATAIRARSKK